jgi:heme a synthase
MGGVSAPSPASPWLRRALVTNLVLQVLIVVTGGVVRLTGSGLGCPTWPNCLPGSYSPVVVEATAYHQYIENANRLLGAVVMAGAVAAVVAVWRWARGRGDLARLAWAVLVGTALQVVLGGVTVLTGLHPLTVMGHFLISTSLVALSTLLVLREREPRPVPSAPAVPALVRRVGWLTAGVGAVVIVLGTVVTGSGPHSGDADEPARFGFDPRTVAWLHADSVMLFCGLVVAVVLAVHLLDRAAPARQAWRTVLLVTVAQGLVGYVQYATDLPELLVLVHMLGAALLTATLTWAVHALHRPEVTPREAPSGAAGRPPRRETPVSGS